MITRSQRIRLGIFIALALTALIVSIGVIVAPVLLEERDVYFIAYEDVSVTGLQEGSGVKYQGIQVGFVSDISIDPQDIRRILLKVSLEKGTPIKVDTKAEIAFLGITGLKLIELKSGSNEADDLPLGSFIPAGRSLAEEITGHAEVLAAKSELVLNNLIELTQQDNAVRIISLVDSLVTGVSSFNRFMADNSGPFHNTLVNTERASTDLDTLMFYAGDILKRVNAFAASDTLHSIVNNIAEVTDELNQAELVRLFQEINRTLSQTNNMLHDVEISFAKSRTDLVYTIDRLKESVDYLNQFSRLVSEDPSILVRGAEPKKAPDYKLRKRK
jgi:phospholipid/cholesterol/gamma-HCH transport system substrate-binding protein